MDALNTWIGTAFAPENLDRTVQALVESQGGARETGDHDQARQRRDEAQAKLRWFQAAIAAGIDPAALVDVINEAEEITLPLKERNSRGSRTSRCRRWTCMSGPSVASPAVHA